MTHLTNHRIAPLKGQCPAVDGGAARAILSASVNRVATVSSGSSYGSSRARHVKPSGDLFMRRRHHGVCGT
jgi:hypothetical protein